MDELDEMQEIRGFFLEEAEELFENINSILLEAEQNGELSEDDITRLFRDIHTLKGGSGSVELEFFAKYIHYLENLIDSLRKGDLKSTAELINFLIEEQDILADIISEEHEGILDLATYKTKLDNLLEKIENFNTIEQTPIVENNFNLEEYSPEFVDMNSTLLKILQDATDDDFQSSAYVAEVFRQLHTLKGSSSFMGLVYFPKYLHDLESLLDKARNGEVCYTEKFHNAIIKTMKIAEEIAFEEFSEIFDVDSFDERLDAVNELFESAEVKQKCNTEDTDLGFELFDTTQTKVETTDTESDLGFELFDTTTADVNNEDSKDEDVGFELFDTTPAPIKEEIKPQKKEEEKPKKKLIPKPVKNKKPVVSSSIRVGLDKIDFLMNRVGDLVITKSMLYKFLQDLSQQIDDPSIIDRLSRLDREIRELQEAVMAVRMIPMESVYAKLPKVIRDLAKKLDKKVDFIHLGDSVEIDKLMVEGLTDPMTHIIRNSLDHGIEKPEIRIAKGKKETGTITISATQESGHIVIEIKDDGAGINVEKVLEKALENNVVTQKEAQLMSHEDKAMLIFSAGLSTADKVSDVSGRGVGMDVVMSNISSLGGSIKIKTAKDKGSTITILLPLTLAILDGLNVLVGDKEFIMPLNMIVESLQPNKEMIKKVGDNQKEILMLRNEFIPIIRLHKFFNIDAQYTDIEKGMLIVTRVANMKAAIFVDDFLNQEQIVVKSLEKNYKKIKGIGAATIRGDGSIGLILDVLNIIENEKALSWN